MTAWGRIAKVGVVAALYFGLGRLALLIAIPPGYATAVWPAAGIALAAILLYGYRLWPGIFIGSFFVNVTTALDSTNIAGTFWSVALPIVIAAGAVLQALLGAFLVRRFVGFPNDFDRVAKIIGTMALGGPLACAVNATIGVGSLVLSGTIEGAHFAGSWGTWWLGDTIGVMLVIPLAAAWGVERHQTRRRTRVLVVLPILAAITMTALAYLDTRAREMERAQLEFERRAEIMARALEQSVMSKTDIVQSIVDFFGAVPETKITRAQVQALVEPVFEQALRVFQEEEIGLRIMDTSGSEKASMLFSNLPPSDETVDRLPALDWSTDLAIAGRRWTVQFRPSSGYTSTAQWDKVWAVLTGGLLFTSLFGALLLAVAGRAAVSERANAALQREIDERLLAQAALNATEAKILETQKLESLGVLAGGIAHDFNNLLAGVLGNADLALLDLPRSSPLREHLRDIKTSAQRAADLANQLLAYSGKGRFVIELTDLSKLVNEISHLVEVSVPKKVSVKYDVASDLPLFEADATQVRQLVLNLITNAAEAIGDMSGVVSISTGQMRCDASYLADSIAADSLSPGLYVFLQVSDTGSGMDQETQSKIFDPFFTTKFTGRGLGLAAALGIVRGHRGAIRVESEPGVGTTIKVLFPASERSASVQAAEPAPEVAWKGDGIALIVDDEQAVLQVSQRMLELMGLATLTASNGAEALQIFDYRADEIAVVLLDLTMPRMDGEETFMRLRQIKQDVKVILSSGYSQQDTASRFAGNGPVGFIQKPYQMDALRDIVRRALES